MKTIAVVTNSKQRRINACDVGKGIRNNLTEVFKDHVIINTYYLDELHGKEEITEDITIIMASSRGTVVREHVLKPETIIQAGRTFAKEGLKPLYNIPFNSDVLVVNDNIETILDSVSSLYNIGIRHLNLIPFELGKSYKDIQYALSPDEEDLVPDNIQTKINVGARVIDISTMLLIMNNLGLDREDIRQNLLKYQEKIAPANEGVTGNFESLITRTEELDQLLDLSNDGILLTDKNGKILVHNKTFKDLFDLKKPQNGLYLHKVLGSVGFDKYFDKAWTDDLIIFKNKQINMEKRDVHHTNNVTKMYFCFQEVTHIKKLEQNLSQKLRQKGHIAKYHFEDIITKSNDMLDIIEKSKRIAKSDLTVLITGESGTGKEVLAQAIHNSSDRKNQPFIAINAAAIPDNLLESELFGYTSGSFTGALKQGKKGYFEMANNGTIFLDEIGDLPYHLQSKLLRVLQERQITPIGSDTIIEIDVRVIAATHKNILEMVESGKFRKDLFYRINVFPLELPPLSKRKDDIMLLINRFTNSQYNFSNDAITLLEHYNWPGNIREVNNIARYIMTIETKDTVTKQSLPHYIIPSETIDTINRSKDSKTENILAEKYNLKTVLEVLKTINFLNDIEKTAGRKHLLEKINREQTIVKESELRKILDTLSSLDLIVIKKGRAGSFITDKGKTLL